MFKFEQLDIWKESIAFANQIYSVTKTFPRDELFGLSNQLRRSASSVPANIAEGSGSSHKKDFSHYLDIAIKSLYETVSHLYIVKENGYIVQAKLDALYGEAEVLVRKIKAFRSWLLNH